MKKVILGLIGCTLMFTNATYAENITFSGNLADACTISGVTPGVLNVSGSGINTAAAGGATVTNNSNGAFTLDFTAPTAWDSNPAEYSGTTTFNGGFTTTGANAVGSLVTTLSLANMGTDTASIEVSGTSDAVYPAGAYSATAVLSCNAI